MENLTIRSYQKGDEAHILPLFNEVFLTHRTIDAWQWRFCQNPYGDTPMASTAWYDDQLAAHYAAYPVLLDIAGTPHLTYQVGDTFTVPRFRGKGHGPRSLLARVVAEFHQTYCHNKIDFFYGFNRGRIQKLGKLFLGYEALQPVYEWYLPAQVINMHYRNTFCKRCLLHGFTVQHSHSTDTWADSIWRRARPLYPYLIRRDHQYLHWRYEINPEHEYHFFVLKQWGKPQAWAVAWQNKEEIIWGDGLFATQSVFALQAVLHKMIQVLSTGQNQTVISAWFSQRPQWWQRNLEVAGLQKQRQRDKLDLCLTRFNPDFDARDFAHNFYFSRGDSDLF